MAGIFQISEATSLALHSMAVMAREEGVLNVKEIAHEFGASEAHLAKVLQRLVRANLVQSLRGPQGGFSLARPKEEITLLEIYEAVEGPLMTEGCILSRKICPFNRCLFNGLLEKVSQEFRDYLSTRRLSDLVNGS